MSTQSNLKITSNILTEEKRQTLSKLCAGRGPNSPDCFSSTYNLIFV